MARTTIDTWNNNFPELSPAYSLITPKLESFRKLDQWPVLDDYNQLLTQQQITNFNEHLITAVPQGYKPEKHDDLYESRIYKSGELQTRLENWHDFFNAAIWLNFPKTKATLNALHYTASTRREPGTNRSIIENGIALFDECGAVIVVKDKKIKELIINHQWQELFIENRSKFHNEIKLFIFGHAIYEKMLNPYIGMITQSIIQIVDENFFELKTQNQLNKIDSELSAMWKDNEISSSKDLQPFPLLGIPGWWPEQDNAFYNNTEYFRPRPETTTN